MSLFIPKKSSKPQSQAVRNGELAEKARVVSNPTIKPLIKPGRVASGEGSLKDRLANMSIEPMETNSDEWNKKVDIQAVKKEIKLPTTYLPELKDTQKRSTYAAPTYTPTPDIKAVEDLFESLKIDPEENVSKEEYTVKGLEVELMEHQIAGVKFLKKREKKDISGGFLCDDMGLGKTVQSIALILKNKPKKDSDGPISTLVVGPLAVLDQWAEEIRSKAPKLSVTVHQGPKRTDIAQDLAKYRVVVTTYDTVVSEFKKTKEGWKSALFDNVWYRIIADEAHVFRNPKSQMSMGMKALKSEGKRWCLTGTPLHNSVDDLRSLLAFIGVEAYADEETWKNLVSTPIKRGDARALKLLKELLQSLMLRREQKVIQLPKCTRHRSELSLNNKEKAIVKHILESTRLGYPETTVLKKLTQIRQVCDDFSLLADDVAKSVESKLEKQSGDENSSKAEEDDDDTDALAELLGEVSISASQKQGESVGSKTKAVVELVKKEKTRKTVIFSVFVTMLELLASQLRNEGIGCKVYQGSLSANARRTMLHDFRTNDDTSVLLCSLTCAAVGINITAASRVIMVEPWWNPMIVDQAINRVHRIGQKVPVDVYEMMVRDSFEERAFVLQDRKRTIAKNLLEKGDALSKSEIQFLLYGHTKNTLSE